MHFFSSPLGTAMLVTLTANVLVLATPTPPVTSIVPKPASPGAERHLVTGTVVPESEAALLSADHDGDLVFATVSVDKDGNAVHDDDESLDKRSYRGSCSSCTIVNNNALRCNCRNQGGGWTWSELNLNNCLANANGQLDWRRGGNYQSSCSSWALVDQQHFSTKCTTYPGGPSSWTYQKNLDERIHNGNGVLRCDV
ncbi:Cyanovirin-N [Rhypophila sp. PSN 637]